MTLLISIASTNGVWQAADCRLSGRLIPNDHIATKLCRLDTSNSKGVIGYSGLGGMQITSTSQIFELSQWLKKSLQGKKRSLDETITKIINSAEKQQIRLKASGDHSFIACSFDNKLARQDYISTYSTYALYNFKTKEKTNFSNNSQKFQWHKNIITGQKGVAMSINGSGKGYVHQNEIHRLNRLVNEATKSRKHTNRVNVYLAQIIRNVSKREGNITVGPESISVCIQPDETSWSKFYDKYGKTKNGPIIPTVAVGLPVDDIISAIRPTVEKALIDLLNRPENFDKETFDKKMKDIASKINDKPDDSLP